jgi:hypothetical protein
MKLTTFNDSYTDKKTLEKLSSAFTLSDMEIFIFPELYYPLVIANIMSPIIWKWRDDPWFSDFEKKSFNYKANRIKQYIIQNYVFNLDLSTWGLTDKETEIARFSDFFDIDLLKQSNALFGYEGDRYYFDIDIRKHFGLDKYNSDIIPYWKTETIEAMTAFRHKENFTRGAGECVSLSALYAAAMFVVGHIPLEKIFLIATPLHSQNFITEKEGLITNNRRIVTRNMWFNGTSLSEKARRALENEKVTIVSHISGYIHMLYGQATIDPSAYSYFSTRLREFLVTDLTIPVFINFLRFKSKYKSLFQYNSYNSGKKRYIDLEKMFEYEHTSRYKVSTDSRESLITEIEGEEFHLSPIQGKIIFNDVETIINQSKGKSTEEIENCFIRMNTDIPEKIIRSMFRDLREFISTDPKLPDPGKEYIKTSVPEISVSDSRDAIKDKIFLTSGESEMSKLALYIFRQMDLIDWPPFVKAAIERNPVCFSDLGGKTYAEVYYILLNMENESIYDGQRLALPDEVWNFSRGDGIEKALLMADLVMHRDKEAEVRIDIDRNRVILKTGDNEYMYSSDKDFKKSILISGSGYSIS